MRLALVADWITTAGGAERALAELHAIWPDSPVFTTVSRGKGDRERPLRGVDIRTSRLQRLYRIVGRHQLLLPFMPRAIEDLDLQGYDVILSSSHAVGKGIIPPSDSVHVCYCHTPMRYAWEMENQYLEDFHVPKILRRMAKRRLSALRRWDLSTAKRVDAFIANSSETAERIERIYGRASTVIPPPVQGRFFETPLMLQHQRSGFIAVGRLVPYKRFDVLIECANILRLSLTIVGAGQEEKRLKAMAGPTVAFRGRVADEELPVLYARAKAVLFSAHEDAGIVPLEAQACGTPVVAYDRGGVRDTVIDGTTGLFFTKQNADVLVQSMKTFSAKQFDPATIREHARKFSSERFRTRIRKTVEEALLRYSHEKTI